MLKVSVKFNFAQVDELRAKLKGLSPKGGETIQQAMHAAQHAALQLVVNGFNRAQAPDGQPWAPLKYGARRGRRPLRKTGKLLTSYRIITTTRGFMVRSDYPIATFHQYGTRTIPARQMVPEKGDQRWNKFIVRAIHAALEKAK